LEPRLRDGINPLERNPKIKRRPFQGGVNLVGTANCAKGATDLYFSDATYMPGLGGLSKSPISNRKNRVIGDRAIG
jgi:hypothetical protein